MDKRLELVKYAKLTARNHLVHCSSGNISVKDKSAMLIKASGVYMEKARKSDFVPVDIKTLKYNRKSSAPSCEYRMHAACYKARQDIACVLHTHPFYSTLLLVCSITPKFILPESILTAGSKLGLISYVCPGTEKLAKNITAKIKKHNIIFLKNHGLLVVGADLKQAYERTILTEQMAKMQVLAYLMGRKISAISPAQAKKIIKDLAKK
ncbi:MAG: class II aldolase/adducin family protein [Candidatus Omnitrophota bacterium]